MSYTGGVGQWYVCPTWGCRGVVRVSTTLGVYDRSGTCVLLGV